MKRGLTVGAQGGGQHLDALVPDGVSGGQLGAQRSAGGEAGRHGAGRGGRGFRGVGFSFPGKKSRPYRAVQFLKWWVVAPKVYCILYNTI